MPTKADKGNGYTELVNFQSKNPNRGRKVAAGRGAGNTSMENWARKAFNSLTSPAGKKVKPQIGTAKRVTASKNVKGVK